MGIFRKIGDWLTEKSEHFVKGDAPAYAGYYGTPEAERSYSGMGAQGADDDEEQVEHAGVDPFGYGEGEYGGRVPYKSRYDIERDSYEAAQQAARGSSTQSFQPVRQSPESMAQSRQQMARQPGQAMQQQAMPQAMQQTQQGQAMPQAQAMLQGQTMRQAQPMPQQAQAMQQQQAMQQAQAMQQQAMSQGQTMRQAPVIPPPQGQPMPQSQPARQQAQAAQQPYAYASQGYAQASGNVVPFPGMMRGTDGAYYAHVEYIVSIHSRSECQTVISYMKTNASVYLNMEFIASDSDRQRCVDLLSGAAYTLGCRLNKISVRGIYLISSPTVQVVLDAPTQRLSTVPEAQGFARQRYDGEGMGAYAAQRQATTGAAPVTGFSSGSPTTRFRSQGAEYDPSVSFGSVMAGGSPQQSYASGQAAYNTQGYPAQGQ